MLGHELRNPLAPVRIAVDILRDAPPNSGAAQRARDSLGRQVGHMTRLLDDLLDISRITHGKIQLQLAPLDLGRAIDNAVEAARPLIDSFGHSLAVSMPAGKRVVVRGDAVRLAQVVTNLLNNAAKYTDRGGRIEIVVEPDGDDVRLVVRDNGIGLAAEELERIFELFSQTESARQRTVGGLGIGLTLVRRLVELHGGSVEARSDGPRLGAEIVVRLPAEISDAPVMASKGAELPDASPKKSTLRVLAVDDNNDLVDGLAAILGLWGHTVRIARDGHQALEVAGAFAPQVVLVDLGLPRVDGFEVGRRLQTGESVPALLVSMSGFGGDDAKRRSNEAGFQRHLVKPFEMDELRALLDDFVRRYGESSRI
jgi:CheY-like chemotaxis protein